jgi:hypothetical protein
MRANRRPLLLGIGIALLCLAGARFIWPVQSSSFLGMTESCGNALGFVAGADKNADSLDMGFCSGPLHNAVTESAVLAGVGCLVIAGGAVATSASRKPRAPAGWYPAPWDPSIPAWWDGKTWWLHPPAPPRGG